MTKIAYKFLKLLTASVGMPTAASGRSCVARILMISNLIIVPYVGGSAVTIQADDVIEGWKTGLTQWKATQHMTTNHRVSISDDKAYEYTLARFGSTWKITRHVYVALMVSGPRELFEQADVRSEWLQ